MQDITDPSSVSLLISLQPSVTLLNSITDTLSSEDRRRSTRRRNTKMETKRIRRIRRECGLSTLASTSSTGKSIHTAAELRTLNAEKPFFDPKLLDTERRRLDFAYLRESVDRYDTASLASDDEGSWLFCKPEEVEYALDGVRQDMLEWKASACKSSLLTAVFAFFTKPCQQWGSPEWFWDEIKTGDSVEDKKADEALKAALVRQMCMWGLIKVLEEREKAGSERVVVNTSDFVRTRNLTTGTVVVLDPIIEEEA